MAKACACGSSVTRSNNGIENRSEKHQRNDNDELTSSEAMAISAGGGENKRKINGGVAKAASVMTA